MRNSVNINKEKLGKIGYQNAPIRQILKLKIPQFEQLLLLNFFSNSTSWKVSINSISEAFGKRKDRCSVRTGLNNLKESEYVILDKNGYTINLDKINSDYQQNIKTDSDTTIGSIPFTNTGSNPTIDSDTTIGSISITNTGSNPTIDSIPTIGSETDSSYDSNTTRGVTGTLPGNDSNTTSVIDSNTTSNKRNIIEKEIKNNQEIKPLKGILSDFKVSSDFWDIPDQNSDFISKSNKVEKDNSNNDLLNITRCAIKMQEHT